MKTKETSTRELAIIWWNNLDLGVPHLLTKTYFKDRSVVSLTGREIEEIYDKEVLEPKRQEEWQESQVNCRYTKPNAKKFKQFDESLFKAYIDKFSDEDKKKALQILCTELNMMLSW